MTNGRIGGVKSSERGCMNMEKRFPSNRTSSAAWYCTNPSVDVLESKARWKKDLFKSRIEIKRKREYS